MTPLPQRAPGPRATLRILRRLIRNPLHAWPAEVYTQPAMRRRMLGQDTLFVQDPALIGAVLNTQAEAFEKADSMRRPLRPALGEAILTADAAQWRPQRRAAAPVFRPDRVRAFLPAMRRAAAAQRDAWMALPAGSVVDVGHAMMRTTFAIITETMLSGDAGIDPARIERGITRYLNTTSWAVAASLLRLPRWVPWPGRWRAAREARWLRRQMLALVERPKGNLGDAPSTDLFAALRDARDPETGQGLSARLLADNLLTFIVAGHETTALALTWTLRLLADHPDVAAHMRTEIAAAGPEPDPDALPYVAQVVQEAMRLYPPAAVIVRRAIADIQLGPHAVTRETNVYVPTFAVHRHADLWPDPERFDPDRFGADAVRARPRYAYLPFGAGPRVCIGAGFALTEAVVILAALLPTLHLHATAPLPEPVLRITLRPAVPVLMRLMPDE